MLRAIIIDDEQAGIDALKFLVDKHTDQVKVIAVCTDAMQGIRTIEDYTPDVVFLDISMPAMNGFTMLEQLQYKDFKLVFTTAHQDYAIKAIKHKAMDYLLKPIDGDELRRCITNIVNEKNKGGLSLHENRSGVIELSVKDGIIFIKHPDIVRLEASGSYTVFHLDNHIKQMASKSLKEFEAQLNPTIFYRCHNSHIINLKKVNKFISSDGFFAQMSDGSVAEIARKNKDVFLDKLKKML